jgi:putative oxidoreductase
MMTASSNSSVNDFGAAGSRDVVILLARITLVALFVIFGWEKVTGFGFTEGYFAHLGLPVPALATLFAIFAELVVGIALVLGVATRPLAVFLALYTVATGLIGHQYWTQNGRAEFEAMINFYKNISIFGGLILLYVTGAGKYSLDARLGLA